MKLYCYDLESGKRLWEREVYRGNPRGGRHRKNSFASETPVTDGENVYVYFTQHGLYAFDVDGKEVWTAPLAAHPTIRDYGTGASPALHGDRLFVLNDNEEESFLAAFDKRTGKEIWRTPRSFSTPRKTGWSTPFVWENQLRTEVVTIGPGAVISYGLDGKELWRMERMGAVAIQSPFAWNGLLYVTSGTSGDDNRPIVAIRPGGSGDITPKEPETKNEHVVWYNRLAGGTYLPTPLIFEGALYVLSEKGDLRPARPRDRRACLSIPHRARCFGFHRFPWAYNGKIFALSEEGTTYVIEAGRTFRLLEVNPLEDWALASPAIAGDRLLVRTQSRLYSLRKGASGGVGSHR